MSSVPAYINFLPPHIYLLMYYKAEKALFRAITSQVLFPWLPINHYQQTFTCRHAVGAVSQTPLQASDLFTAF